MVIKNFPFSWRTIFTLKLLAEGRLERASVSVDGGKGSTNNVAFPALNYISSQKEILLLLLYLSWTAGTGRVSGSSVVRRGEAWRSRGPPGTRKAPLGSSPAPPGIVVEEGAGVLAGLVMTPSMMRSWMMRRMISPNCWEVQHVAGLCLLVVGVGVVVLAIVVVVVVVVVGGSENIKLMHKMVV